MASGRTYSIQPRLWRRVEELTPAGQADEEGLPDWGDMFIWFWLMELEWRYEVRWGVPGRERRGAVSLLGYLAID